MLISAEDRISRARIVLERRGLVAAELLPRPIAESWQRCLSSGLDPQRPPQLDIVDAPGVRQARERAAALRRLALGEMENLYHQIAGTNFMIAFAAPDGILLDTMCDSSFNDTARVSSIRPGTLWAEPKCGTNALGTVAQTGQAITVHGTEHFFSCFGALTCIAVPVMGADGLLAGVLDASSDCRSRQQHTHALVSMAATQIENGLFRECHRGDLIIAFHSRAEFLHTLSVGLLAVDWNGVILAVNARAGFLLQGLPAVRGRRFEEVFRTGLDGLVRAARSDARQRLEDQVGSAFAAKLESFPKPRTASPGVLAPPAPSRPRPVAAPASFIAPASFVAPAGFVAQDAAVLGVLRQVEAAACRRLPVLIRGATGTGKEQLARHAHRASGRCGAFVPVNCAGLPDTLIEAELFGHADGAFTGARRGGAPGLVAESDGGTLFLDEIGDMKLALQSVLLRLLDDWTVRPVGGGRQRQVDVLLIAATNVDLEQAVAAGRFRADLLYRINTVDVTLPPLCRRADFEAIARYLLADIAPEAELTPEAAALLAKRPWPGNARELRSVLTRLTLADAARVIDGDTVQCMAEALAAVPGGFRAPVPVVSCAPDPVVSSAPVPGDPAPRSLRVLLADRVRQMHHDLNGNITETARQLGVSRNTVYRALRIHRPHGTDHAPQFSE